MAKDLKPPLKQYTKYFIPMWSTTLVSMIVIHVVEPGWVFAVWVLPYMLTGGYSMVPVVRQEVTVYKWFVLGPLISFAIFACTVVVSIAKQLVTEGVGVLQN